MTILTDLTREQLVAMVQAQQAKLDKAANRSVWVRVNALGDTDSKGNPCKGNISVGGLMRFPVTLYANQWEKLMAVLPEIKQAIEDNREVLSFGRDE